MLALSQMPTTRRNPARCSASATRPAGLVKLNVHARGARTSARAATLSRAGTLRIAMAKPPGPVVSWPSTLRRSAIRSSSTRPRSTPTRIVVTMIAASRRASSRSWVCSTRNGAPASRAISAWPSQPTSSIRWIMRIVVASIPNRELGTRPLDGRDGGAGTLSGHPRAITPRTYSVIPSWVAIVGGSTPAASSRRASSTTAAVISLRSIANTSSVKPIRRGPPPVSPPRRLIQEQSAPVARYRPPMGRSPAADALARVSPRLPRSTRFPTRFAEAP